MSVREIDRVSRTMGDECQGSAPADDSGAHAPGTGTLARHLSPVPGLDGSGHGGGAGHPHTIGRWASAFGGGGTASLIFEQTGGSPPSPARRS